MEIARQDKKWLVSDCRRTENVSDQKFSAAVLNRVYYPKPVQKDKKRVYKGRSKKTLHGILCRGTKKN